MYRATGSAPIVVIIIIIEKYVLYDYRVNYNGTGSLFVV